MAVCVAVIGKDNSPLYIGGIGNDTSTDNELSRQWLVHTALDALEERLTTNNSSTTGSNTNNTRTDLRDLYLGLLYSTDTHKIYGYVTNTRIKLVLVTSSTSPSGSNIRDAEVRTALRRLHALYADAICNPFHLPGDQIISLYLCIITMREDLVTFLDSDNRRPMNQDYGSWTPGQQRHNVPLKRSSMAFSMYTKFDKQVKNLMLNNV